MYDPEFEVRDIAFSTSLGGKSFLWRNDRWAYIEYEEDASKGM
ncbi:hypothetical protein [Leeuwenhoekiella aestuarii]|nr:hypothetical protein [Leeuwenhoekiella aestuarii]